MGGGRMTRSGEVPHHGWLVYKRRTGSRLPRTFLNETGGHGLGELGLDAVGDEEGREHALHFGRPVEPKTRAFGLRCL